MPLIRPARPEDAAPIAAIWNPVIRETTITFTTDEKSEAGLAAAINPEAWRVVEEDRKVAGFGCVFQFRNGPGYRHAGEFTLILAPAQRGRGTGAALMAALEGAARDCGHHALVAGVSAENGAGLRFFGRQGYREVGRLPEVGRKFDRWLDLVLLQKLL
ncbi:N-acetyltransferase [Halovulum dunhuangense]|uniref:N-acetyltransferase n=1 Tax=Halovulum dunhuangense TaxID=1505036 RepID=A0A849L5Q7_9RHOB|nr:GNAT family N-acetyltransferase [Halovulum dunhuangense]NNU81494.1 N-acetyltransferase [Halovulum dunhuangense]